MARKSEKSIELEFLSAAAGFDILEPSKDEKFLHASPVIAWGLQTSLPNALFALTINGDLIQLGTTIFNKGCKEAIGLRKPDGRVLAEGLDLPSDQHFWESSVGSSLRGIESPELKDMGFLNID